jgi:hypothetical protein
MLLKYEAAGWMMTMKELGAWYSEGLWRPCAGLDNACLPATSLHQSPTTHHIAYEAAGWMVSWATVAVGDAHCFIPHCTYDGMCHAVEATVVYAARVAKRNTHRDCLMHESRENVRCRCAFQWK